MLFLVDAAPVASAVPDAKDCDAEASAAKEAEEAALAAMKAAWHAAKDARQVCIPISLDKKIPPR